MYKFCCDLPPPLQPNKVGSKIFLVVLAEEAPKAKGNKLHPYFLDKDLGTDFYKNLIKFIYVILMTEF